LLQFFVADRAYILKELVNVSCIDGTDTISDRIATVLSNILPVITKRLELSRLQEILHYSHIEPVGAEHGKQYQFKHHFTRQLLYLIIHLYSSIQLLEYTLRY